MVLIYDRVKKYPQIILNNSSQKIIFTKINDEIRIDNYSFHHKFLLSQVEKFELKYNETILNRIYIKLKGFTYFEYFLGENSNYSEKQIKLFFDL